eukprot:TRINITY_DN50068_c0_g1_i1.p1 TRINITY_DN50068_c0_g1~~TRINITY_DN50068_c0_g1_i1.p1  ORF type:complete len:405 (-),score=67.28 TRINITY_DN50068_c0_g1_i1:88-1263(-)
MAVIQKIHHCRHSLGRRGNGLGIPQRLHPSVFGLRSATSMPSPGLAGLAKAKAEAEARSGEGFKQRSADFSERSAATLGILALAGIASLGSAFYEGLWQPLLRDGKNAEEASHCADVAGAPRQAQHSPLLASPKVSAEAASCIAKGKVVVIDGVLRLEEVAEIRKELEELASAPGGLQLNPKVQAGTLDIRTDRVHYLRDFEISLNPVLAATPSAGSRPSQNHSCRTNLKECHQLLRGVALSLEQGFAAIGAVKKFLVPGWAQLAQFSEGGGFYKWHKDGFEFPSWYWALGPVGLFIYFKRAAVIRRDVTAILYLNEQEWPTSAGGALKCRAPAVAIRSNGSVQELECASEECSEILPVGGRLVLFDSHTVEHEVCRTHRERWALTIWIHQ